MKERRECVSLLLLMLQVIWMIVLLSFVTRGFGEPKELVADSVWGVVLYLPTIAAFFSALVETRYPKQKSFNWLSLLALGLSLLILSAVFVKWYQVLWLDAHGTWKRGGV